MAVTYYMNYVIYFTVRDDFDAARAQYGLSITTPPATAAAVFGLTYPIPGGPLLDKGMYYISPWFAGMDLGWYFQSTVGVYFADAAVPTINVPGGQDPFGNQFADGIFTWVGMITLRGGGAVDTIIADDEPVPIPISQRRWAIGFELPDGGESAGPTVGSPSLQDVSRDSSRTPEGYGFCMRELTSVRTMPLANFTGGAPFNQSWERLYVRIRRLPTGSRQMFWRSHGFPSAAGGARLSINPSGTIEFENLNSSSVVTVSRTSTEAVLVDTGYRLDIILVYNPEAQSGSDPPYEGSGSFSLQLNGHPVGVSAVISVPDGGLGQNSSTHQSTDLGCSTGNFGLEMDVDDWINAGVPQTTQLDWLTGSHVVRINPTGFAASHSVNWVGDYRDNLQIPPNQSVGRLTSSTSGARLALTTDAVEGAIAQFGAAAMTVGMYSSRAGVADGTLGYSVGGGAAVLAAIVQQTFLFWNAIMYRPSTLTTPPPPYPPNILRIEPIIWPIEIYHEKGASASASSVAALCASVEYIGAWGPEDGNIGDALVPPIVRSLGTHNAPYPQYELTGAVVSPMRAVAVFGGTYAGNSLGQDITIPYPVHWYWIRRIPATSNGPSHWHSSGVASGWLNTERVVPDSLCRAVLNPVTATTKIQISGNSPNLNETGATYQYIGICDPGMRFLLAGAFMHGTAAASAVMANALLDPNFTPDAVWVLLQQLGSASNTANYWYKGPGHALATAQRVTTSETVNALTQAMGVLTSQTPLHINQGLNGAAAYVAMRMVDDSSASGVLQILSYTGNGVSPRVIPLTPASLRFPLLAVVQPHNAQIIFRDPSHTGSDSSTSTGSITTTGITAGSIDQITVQSTLNANGVIYDVFVIPGSPDGWLNGTFYPVAPISGGSLFPEPGAPVVAPTGCVMTFPTEFEL